jgi:aryl-alcohol dehydrogenase-like predicted oxidoreductase
MPALPIHSLGRNGPKVPAMGYGAMGIAGTYGPAYPDADRFAILDRCLELGCTFWDTADAYYDSEQMIGNWFKRTGKRDSIFLASKFGLGFTPEGTLITRSDPAYAKEACEKSLKTLGVACIDLYYCHRVDKTTPIEETIKAMVELKE